MMTADIFRAALVRFWEEEVEFFYWVHRKAPDKDLSGINRLELYRQMVLALWTPIQRIPTTLEGIS